MSQGCKQGGFDQQLVTNALLSVVMGHAFNIGVNSGGYGLLCAIKARQPNLMVKQRHDILCFRIVQRAVPQQSFIKDDCIQLAVFTDREGRMNLSRIHEGNISLMQILEAGIDLDTEAPFHYGNPFQVVMPMRGDNSRMGSAQMENIDGKRSIRDLCLFLIG
jgi:hypothetical protein